ncbi:hypothetical protein GOBAR_AA00145 [Gossypium barbadense]|uniref:Uncharacterized protein n=1 Tax=Gossypium barbadense TaxID=3634 RepID=A0A2P5YXT5_GOSBA|nr:hypothetical protein GOBAR_AA00145 [Gossypium barbadense]
MVTVDEEERRTSGGKLEINENGKMEGKGRNKGKIEGRKEANDDVEEIRVAGGNGGRVLGMRERWHGRGRKENE